MEPYKDTLKTSVMLGALLTGPNMAEVVETNFIDDYLNFKTSSIVKFEPEYIVDGNKAIELTPSLNHEINSVSSLVTVGDLLFKDSLPKSEEDVAAMQSYIKRKFKKVNRG